MKRIYSFLVLAAFAIPVSLIAQTNRTWRGSTNNQWDMISSNWMNPASPLPLPTSFVAGSNVLFDDTALKDTVNVVSEIQTGDITFKNSTLNYVLKSASTESKLIGTGTFVKEGTGDLKIAVLNQLSGGTIIKGGAIIKDAPADPNCFGSNVSLEGGVLRLGTKANTSSAYYTFNIPINVPEGQKGEVFVNRYTNWQDTKLTGAGNLIVKVPGERAYMRSTFDMSEFTGTITIEGSDDYAVANKVVFFESLTSWDWEAKTGANEMFKNVIVNLVSGGSLGHGSSGNRYTVLGEINAEDETCNLHGYSSNSTSPISYYEIGALNTDVLFKGTIRPITIVNGLPRADNYVGIVKVGTGTYTLTSGDNFITKGIDINEGKIFISNPENSRSGTGYARNREAVIVYENGALGGTGRISGDVSVYGKLEPGENAVGTLLMADLKTVMDTITVATPKKFTLKLAETATAEIELASSADGDFDRVIVDSVSCGGKLVIKLAASYDLKAGDEYRIFVSDKFGGQFSSIELPNSETWNWDTTSLYVNGIIKLVSGGATGTGIESNQAENVSIKVYPNPTSGSFEVDAKDSDILSIQVISIGGLLVHSQSPMSSSAIVELGGIAPGTYIVKVQTADALNVQKIIVKK